MKTLPELRQEIDTLDEQLLELFNARASVALQVGEAKKQINLPIFAPEREAQIIAKMTAKNNGPLTNEQIQALFNLVITSCRNLENK